MWESRAVDNERVYCLPLLCIQDSYGDTALHDATGKDSREIVELLVNYPGVGLLAEKQTRFQRPAPCRPEGKQPVSSNHGNCVIGVESMELDLASENDPNLLPVPQRRSCKRLGRL